jgi:hypothetical protein
MALPEYTLMKYPNVQSIYSKVVGDDGWTSQIEPYGLSVISYNTSVGYQNKTSINNDGLIIEYDNYRGGLKLENNSLSLGNIDDDGGTIFGSGIKLLFSANQPLTIMTSSSEENSGIAGQFLTSNGSSLPPSWESAIWIGNATSDLNMSSYNIINGQGLILQSNSARAEFYVKDETVANQVQIVPTQMAVIGPTGSSTVIVDDGYYCLRGGRPIIKYSNSGLITYKYDSVEYYDQGVFDISVNQLTLAGVAGAAGQVIKLDASGAPVWGNDADMQSIANVITNGSNASGLSITNLSSIQLSNDNGSTNCQLSAMGDVLRLETAPDLSGDAKTFTRGYLPMYVGSQIYYLPLYTTPP